MDSTSHPGVAVTSYLPAAQPSWSIVTHSVEVEAPRAAAAATEVRVLEVAPHSGLMAVLNEWSEQYFAEAPTVSPDGTVSFTPTGFGGTAAVIIGILDLADVTPDGTCKQIGNATLKVNVSARTLLNRPARSEHRAKASPAPSSVARSVSVTSPSRTTMASTSLPPPRTMIDVPVAKGAEPVETTNDDHQALNTGLSQPSIRSLRVEPPRIKQRSFASVVFSRLPMFLMRQWNAHAEYELLTDAKGTPAQAVALLKRIQTAMEDGAVVEAVVPIIDAACRLHAALGGEANLRTAVRLAHLRVQTVGTALGIDTRVATPVDVGAAQRLSSSRAETVELLIRVLVESAHLLKLTGSYGDALKYYRTAAAVVGTQHATAVGGSSAQIPFLFAAGDVHLLRGDLSAAVRLYEEARAHAEMASRGSSIVAECEQQLSFVFSLCNQPKEAEVAAKRAMSIRREQQDSTATAEALLFEASSLAVRGKSAQAAQCVLRARDEAKQAGSHASYVRCVIEAVAGTLDVLGGCSDLPWDPSTALECPDMSVAGYVRWLLQVREPDTSTLEAVHEDLRRVAGSDSLLANIIAMSTAVSLFERDAARAYNIADGCVQSLSANLTSINPLLRMAVETATVAASKAGQSSDAFTHAKHLVWMLNESNDTVSYEEAFRTSACVSEAMCNMGPSTTIENVDALYASLLHSVGEEVGHWSPKTVAMLLDAAEVRHVQNDYSGALELLAKALRIVDSKNLLYLIGPLYTPRWLLGPQEARDRDRLCAERFPGTDSLTALAMLLNQLGLTQEASGNMGKAVSALQQSVATFELAAVEHHPGSVAALINLGRCHLTLREHATARVYLERADILFQDHYYDFGRYVQEHSSVLLRAKIDAGLRASRISEKREGSLLCKGYPSNPLLDALQLYV